MKKLLRRLSPSILTSLVYAAARLIGLTLRLRVEGFDRIQALPGGKILAGWHGKTFVAANFFKGKGFWTLISQSRDGEMQNRIFTKFGFKTIRGSTSRGGVRAAVEAIRVLRKGAIMAFTPDGPRGPSGVVQGGIMVMAQKSGASLVPVGVSASRRWRLGTWDRYMIPKPFARAIMLFGEPMDVATDATEEEIEAIRLRLESEIHRLEAEADKAMGHAPDEATQSA
jgi:lysophospholipid acyltransferase (LPLAT)-like uncharacterized protein